MKRSHLLIFFIALLFWLFPGLTVFGQGNVRFNDYQQPPTPQSRDMGRVVFSPANLYTGQPGIGLPIYTVKNKDLEVPISLSYDAGGLIPNKAPSVVGLNWSLVAGGMITRTVNGLPDESSVSGSYPSMGFFVKSTTHTNTEVRELGAGIIHPSTHYYDKIYELAPDLFTFNFSGHTGVFMMGQDGEFRFQGDEVYQVDKSLPNYVNVGLYTGKITMTDLSGVKYEFGGNSFAFEYSETESAENRIATAWYLTKITAPEGYSIEFEYGELKGTNSDFTRIEIAPSELRTVRNVYLRRIVSKTITGDVLETVEFNTSLRATGTSFSYPYKNEQLDYIYVKDENSNTKKTFQFTYTDFNYATGQNRWLLSTFREVGTQPAVYTFGYRSGLGGSVPQQGKSDFWGYYNGKDKPPPTTYYYNGSMEMVSPPDAWKADSAKAAIGVLTSITHPTGGKTIYEYEGHKYAGYVRLGSPASGSFVVSPAEGVAGGIRIKKVHLRDANGTTLETREYKYVTDYNPGEIDGPSSGILYRMPVLYRFNTPIPALNGVGEPHMTYSEVTEVFGDGGYRTHKFVSANSRLDRAIDMYTTPKPYQADWGGTGPIGTDELTVVNFYNNRSSLSLERGQPWEVTDYNSTGYKVSRTNYSYNTTMASVRYGDANRIVSAVMPPFGQPGDMPGLTIPLANLVTTYESYFFPTGVTREVKRTYAGTADTAAIQVVTTAYTYNGNRQVASRSVVGPAGVQEMEKYRYVGDYSLGSTSTHVLKKMQNLNILSPVVEQQRLRRSGSTVRLLGGTLYTYGQPVIANAKIFRPASFKELRLLAPSADTTMASISGSSMSHHSGYVQAGTQGYDSKGNLTEDRYPLEAPQMAYKWSEDGRYPIAEVSNTGQEAPYVTSAYETATVTSGTVASKSLPDVVAGTMSLSIGASPGHYYEAYYSLSGPVTRSGTLCADRTGSTPCSFPESVTLTGIVDGNYTLTITVSTPNTAIYRAVTASYTKKGTGKTGGFFFEDFEASGSAGTAHTGRKFKLGDYTVNYVRPDSRAYVVSYWYRSGTSWLYSPPQAYSGPSMALTLGDAIDDVRIHPKESQMTTYTYDPLVGMTSKTDASGRTVYYEYDTQGRLTTVRDTERNIVESYKYNYGN